MARRAVTSCVWDYAGGMTMLRAFRDAALEIEPDAPDEDRTMRHCSPRELARLGNGPVCRRGRGSCAGPSERRAPRDA